MENIVPQIQIAHPTIPSVWLHTTSNDTEVVIAQLIVSGEVL
jgi:hypothetical protein